MVRFPGTIIATPVPTKEYKVVITGNTGADDSRVVTNAALKAGGIGYDATRVAVVDVALMVTVDGSVTWTPCDGDEFPADGLTFTLPYPEGSDKTCDFIVTHLYQNGPNAGQTEVLPVTKTDDGLVVSVSSLSPFAIAWKSAASQTEKPVSTPTNTKNNNATGKTATDNPKTGDETPIVLWSILLLFSLAAVPVTVRARKKRSRE